MNLKLIKLPDIQVIHTTTGLENNCKAPYVDPARQKFVHQIHVEPQKIQFNFNRIKIKYNLYHISTLCIKHGGVTTY